MSHSKLRFRIAYFASEDKEYPVTELLKHGPQSRGWQSARFQEYPQVVVLEFIGPVRLQQLQFLSHQSKISSKIELYTYLPEDASAPVAMEYFKWKRLGYLSLDTNENSGFQARELKSVYIDVNAQFLKIVLNKPHANAHNVFAQVGLIAINALGEELGGLKPPSTKGLSRLENDIEFDPVTSEKIKQLMAAKERAVQNENFDEAKQYKDAIDRLRGLGQQLQHLEEHKRIAIASEDYDRAKILKAEIDRMRNAVAPPVAEPVFNRPPSGVQVQQHRAPPPQMDIAYQSRKAKLWGEDPPKAYDEQVIPTMQQGRPPPPDEMPVNDNAPEPLNANAFKLADPLIPILGEDLCRRLFSKSWQFREEAISTLQREVNSHGSQLFAGMDSDLVYAGTLGAIRYTVGDKVASVAFKAMALVNTLFESQYSSRGILRGDVPDYIQHIMAQLLDKVGDSNSRMKDNAESTFITIAKNELMGISPAVQLILKPPPKEKATSTKHLMGRLNLLNSMVRAFKIDKSNIPFAPVMEYAIAGFKHSSADVRNAAYYLIISIYSQVGQRIHQYLQDLRPAQVELLEKGFADVDGGTFTEPIRQPSQMGKRPPDAPTPTDVPFCQFCGKKDPIFSNQDNLDIHYWKDCPMLVACHNCNQVVEVRHLNTHLLEECELSEAMRKCPRCNEAYHMEEFEQHLEEQACIPAKPLSKANRCPLCHEDVKPGIEGWKEHILIEGCHNNDRSNY